MNTVVWHDTAVPVRRKQHDRRHATHVCGVATLLAALAACSSSIAPSGSSGDTPLPRAQRRKHTSSRWLPGIRTGSTVGLWYRGVGVFAAP
jgi:hypothetical protein